MMERSLGDVDAPSDLGRPVESSKNSEEEITKGQNKMTNKNPSFTQTRKVNFWEP